MDSTFSGVELLVAGLTATQIPVKQQIADKEIKVVNPVKGWCSQPPRLSSLYSRTILITMTSKLSMGTTFLYQWDQLTLLLVDHLNHIPVETQDQMPQWQVLVPAAGTSLPPQLNTTGSLLVETDATQTQIAQAVFAVSASTQAMLTCCKKLAEDNSDTGPPIKFVELLQPMVTLSTAKRDSLHHKII